jgi:Common central domain of tyrosinase
MGRAWHCRRPARLSLGSPRLLAWPGLATAVGWIGGFAVGVRKSQARLSAGEWRDFVAAVDATHGMGIPAPRYRDFVRVHVDAMTTAEGMRWGVHTMQDMGMVGRNFLAWHRQFLVQLERRLQVVRPGLSVPYWDWTRDRALPPQLSSRAL